MRVGRGAGRRSVLHALLRYTNGALAKLIPLNTATGHSSTLSSAPPVHNPTLLEAEASKRRIKQLEDQVAQLGREKKRDSSPSPKETKKDQKKDRQEKEKDGAPRGGEMKVKFKAVWRKRAARKHLKLEYNGKRRCDNKDKCGFAHFCAGCNGMCRFDTCPCDKAKFLKE